MSRYFTHYWNNSTWLKQKVSSYPDDVLEHTASNLFVSRGVQNGDFIYVVTVIKGTLFVLGKMKVAQICDQATAAEYLQCDPERLWDATDHLIAAFSTRMNFEQTIPVDIALKLQFINSTSTAPLVFRTDTMLDTQTIRGVRQLTLESARVLDELVGPMFDLNLLITDEALPEAISTSPLYFEGTRTQITVNAYERNRNARLFCIEYYGAICLVCGFDFQEVYGEIGEGYIHVHHIVPLHQIGSEYLLDPINDLKPVCPNCHAMLHRANPPFTIEEMQKIVQGRRFIS